MSWSVQRKGTPTQVKEQLITDFANAKNITASVPVEQKAVEQAEQICNLLLDDMISSEYPFVQVNGYGSGQNTNPQWNAKANVQFCLQVTPMMVEPK